MTGTPRKAYIRVERTEHGIPGESFWVHEDKPGRWRVTNILLNGVVSLGDIVELDENDTVTSVLSRNPLPTWAIMLETTAREDPVLELAATEFSELVISLASSRFVAVEGMFPGLVLLATEETQINTIIDEILLSPYVDKYRELFADRGLTEGTDPIPVYYDQLTDPTRPLGTDGLDLTVQDDQTTPTALDPDFTWDPRTDERAVNWASAHSMPGWSTDQILDGAEWIVTVHPGMQDAVRRGDTIRPLLTVTNFHLSDAGLPTLRALDDE